MDNLENCDSIVPNSPLGRFEASPKRSPRGQPGLFQRIFESFLSEKKEKTPPMSQKVCCHKESADKVREQLEKIKKELQNELDDELFPMITEVIDPLLRDVERINRLMKRENGEETASEQFREWTDNAKLWVGLFSKNKDKDTIKLEVLKHIIEKSLEKIDRDIRFIEGYFKQHMEQLDLVPEEINIIKKKKIGLVSEHLRMLRTLQVIPAHGITFNEVSTWRQKLDGLRAKHHDAALQVIDN
jgi:hypothetical protein